MLKLTAGSQVRAAWTQKEGGRMIRLPQSQWRPKTCVVMVPVETEVNSQKKSVKATATSTKTTTTATKTAIAPV